MSDFSNGVKKLQDIYKQAQALGQPNVTVNNPGAVKEKMYDDVKGALELMVGHNTPQSSPSYTKPNRDIAAEMDLAASMGEWDKFSGLANERMQKVAQNGGYDGGVTTNDLVNQLRARYGKSYNNYQQMQNIQKLLGDVSSPYESIYQSLLKQYQDYTFNDFKNSSTYQSMKDLYELNGKNAMKDVLGEIAARTGGYASSYATATAQEQYQDYMAQLAALAQQMYQGEKNNMLSEVNQMGNRLDDDISRRQTANTNIYNALRQLTLDQKAEEDAETQREAQAEQNARESMKNSILAALNSRAISIEDITDEMWEQSGLSRLEALAAEQSAKNEYEQQQFKNDLETSKNELNWAKYGLSASKAGRSSGGGSRRSSQKSNATDFEEIKGNILRYAETGETKETLINSVDELYRSGEITSEERDALNSFIENIMPKQNTYTIPESRKVK